MEKLGGQGTVEWMMSRVGRITASRFSAVLDKLKSGKPGAKRDAYLYEVVTERLSNQPTDHYVSKPMQDGIEREPFARMRYEAATGAIVEEVGFLPHPTLANVGGSPDGLLGDDGIIEIKAPTPATHIRTLLDGMSEDHLPQIQGLLWITGRQYCDFVSYYPDLPPPLDLHIQRVERDEDYIAALEAEVTLFDQDAEALIARLRPVVNMENGSTIELVGGAAEVLTGVNEGPPITDDDIYITPDQCADLEALCSEYGIQPAALRKAAKVDRLALILASDYSRAVAWVQKHRAAA